MTTEALPNPYVGPRPFQEGERLYGRRREIDELLDLLYAERVVLLHSPSGAGKSSLVAAGLVPRLRKRFAVLPAIRVHRRPPGGAISRYTWSALQSLEAEGSQSLADHLRERPRKDDEPPRSLLVFDQFEEVLSVDPANVEEKRRFFADLGEALADERLWALFVVHEEYVGPLETYRDLLPGGLRSTYRLDFLRHEAAAEAMERPARRAGRTFTDAAVRKLVEELSRVQTQDVDGSIRETAGPFVEPVQLQVVCQQLWDAIPAGDLSIDPEDVERFGDVTRALGSYYDASVAEVDDERAVREWFERELVVAGTRAQVLRGKKESGGLANEQIERLRARHLVRAEQRAGKTWFELAHDRLIEPVRASNRRWFASNLHPVQQQARLWASQGRPPGFRLAGEDLRAAETWAKTAKLTRDEEDFLASSREAQENADEIRRQKERALELARAATASSCLASGETTWGGLFALEVADPETTPTAAAVLHQALASAPDLPVVLEGHGGAVDCARFSPDGRRVLTASTDPTARIWDAWTGECLHVLAGHSGVVAWAAWSGDGRLVVTASHDKTARIWDAETGKELHVLSGHGGQVVQAAWNAGSNRVATASEDRTARIWDVETGECLHVLAGHSVQVQAVAWNADSTRLVTGSLDKTARLWDAGTGQELHVLAGHKDCLNVAAWNADGTRVVTASQDGTACIWTAENGQIDAVLPKVAKDKHEATIFSAAWSGDGTRVATGSADGTARIWERWTGALVHVLKHLEPVLSVAWSPDGTRLLTASRDHKARIWDTWNGKLLDTLSGHADWVLAAEWSGDGRRAVTASRDHTAHVRTVEPGERLHTLPTPRGPWGRADPYTRVAWSGDGRRVVTANDVAAHVWDAWTGELLEGEAGEITDASAALTPASDRLLKVEGTEATIRDAGTGEVVHVLAGHTEKILAAAWSHDGRRVVTASEDTTARLWDAATGELLHTLVGHSSAVLAAAWSEDDTRLLTASKDRTARIWAVGPVEHLQGRIRAETRRTLPETLRRKRLGESEEEARRRAGVREACLQAFFERLGGASRGEVGPYVEAWRLYIECLAKERGSS